MRDKTVTAKTVVKKYLIYYVFVSLALLLLIVLCMMDLRRPIPSEGSNLFIFKAYARKVFYPIGCLFSLMWVCKFVPTTILLFLDIVSLKLVCKSVCFTHHEDITTWYSNSKFKLLTTRLTKRPSTFVSAWFQECILGFDIHNNFLIEWEVNNNDINLLMNKEVYVIVTKYAHVICSIEENI